MSLSKLTDLLPIEPGITKPNAYQVFGVQGPENDLGKLSASIKTVYSRLKAAKSEADPAAWQNAVKLAETARKVLEDPARKKQLDASLGRSAPVDPLADLLPSSQSPAANSVAKSIVGEKSSAASVLGMPPLDPPSNASAPQSASAAVLGTPPFASAEKPASAETPGANSVGDAAAEPKIAVDWSPPKPTKKRKKKSKTVPILFGLFVTVMLAAIGGLLWFIDQGRRVAINPDGVGDGDGIVVSQPRPIDPAPPRPGNKPSGDGILGNVPSSGIAESLRNNGSAALPDVDVPAGMEPPNGEPATTDSTSAGNVMPTADPTPDPMTEPTPGPMTEPKPELTPEMIAAGEAKLKAVEQLIVNGNWDRMKTAADELLKSKLPEPQATRASTLFDIADLATYFRGGLVRGLGTLNTGNTFEYVKDVPVIVVGATDQSLDIRLNRRTYSYKVDEIPPRLAEKIASFSLSLDKPDTIAGLALYRLISKDIDPGYKQDAFEKLRSVDGELNQVDSEVLLKVAEELFPL